MDRGPIARGACAWVRFGPAPVGRARSSVSSRQALLGVGRGRTFDGFAGVLNPAWRILAVRLDHPSLETGGAAEVNISLTRLKEMAHIPAGVREADRGKGASSVPKPWREGFSSRVAPRTVIPIRWCPQRRR
jgi:hypothetical protein